jgi:hypothetical protein
MFAQIEEHPMAGSILVVASPHRFVIDSSELSLRIEKNKFRFGHDCDASKA